MARTPRSSSLLDVSCGRARDGYRALMASRHVRTTVGLRRTRPPSREGSSAAIVFRVPGGPGRATQSDCVVPLATWRWRRRAWLHRPVATRSAAKCRRRSRSVFRPVRHVRVATPPAERWSFRGSGHGDATRSRRSWPRGCWMSFRNSRPSRSSNPNVSALSSPQCS